MRPTHIDIVMATRGFVPAQTAATAVGVHLSTIYRAVTAGHIQGQRCGRHHYVHAESVVQYYRFPGLAEALSDGLQKVSGHEATTDQHLD